MVEVRSPISVKTGVTFHGASAFDMGDYVADAAKGIAVEHWFEAWATHYNIGFNTAQAQAVHDADRMNLITWEPWNPGDGAVQPAYTLDAITAGNHDAHIANWAQGVRAFGHAVFLRFAHEMNGNWYPWGTKGGNNGNTAQDYIDAWRHVWLAFEAQGVDNVTWVWCPNRPFTGSTVISSLYPGDAYVDWLGLDAYNQGTENGSSWLSVLTTFEQGLSELRAVNSVKPLMICETGCSEQGGSKSAWFDSLFASLKTDYSFVRGLTYFHHDKSPTTANWLIDTSPSARDAWRAGIVDSRYGPSKSSSFVFTKEATMVTLATLRAQVRAIADVDATDVSDSEINTYINDAYQEAIGEELWPFLLERTSFAGVPSQRDYVVAAVIASDVEPNRILHVSTQGTKLRKIEIVDYLQLEPQGQAETTGVPVAWAVMENTKLVLWPTPTGTDEIQVIYLKVAPDLTLDADEPLLPSRWAFVLKWGALSYVYQKIGDQDSQESARKFFSDAITQAVADLVKSSPPSSLVWGSHSRLPEQVLLPPRPYWD
jgi:hypothetical protein